MPPLIYADNGRAGWPGAAADANMTSKESMTRMYKHILIPTDGGGLKIPVLVIR